MKTRSTTEEETRQMLAMYRSGLRIIDIVRATGHDRMAVRHALGRPGETSYVRIRTKTGENPAEPIRAVEIPIEVIAERERRLALQPRDLSAALCGDPLPGYSALERRA